MYNYYSARCAKRQADFTMEGFITSNVFYFIVFKKNCLQCFDAVGWATGRASGL